MRGRIMVEGGVFLLDPAGLGVCECELDPAGGPCLGVESGDSDCGSVNFRGHHGGLPWAPPPPYPISIITIQVLSADACSPHIRRAASPAPCACPGALPPWSAFAPLSSSAAAAMARLSWCRRCVLAASQACMAIKCCTVGRSWCSRGPLLWLAAHPPPPLPSPPDLERPLLRREAHLHP